MSANLKPGNLVYLPQQSDEDTLKAQIRYLEAKCNRLEHTNIALTSKVQEVLLLKELENGRFHRDKPVRAS